MVASAVVFLVFLFLLKNTEIFKKTDNLNQGGEGLTYSQITIGELLGKDLDEDGVLDWQEPFYGLDPNKKETVEGVPDLTTMNKLKAEQSFALDLSTEIEGEENLTETEKFSRELFSFIASLNQEGNLDQATIEEIGIALAEKIENSPVKTVFLFSDIRIAKDNTLQAVKDYVIALAKIINENELPDYSPAEVLEKFVIDENNNVDSTVLTQFTPITDALYKRIEEMLKMEVPQSLALKHLDLMNGMEGVAENLDNIKLYESDPILALAAISQLEKSVISFESSAKNLAAATRKELGI